MNNKLVLIRHGESEWNKKNLFTGWCDVDLSTKGKKEAKDAGSLLKFKNIFFDISYTSFLKRAIHTLWIILDELDSQWIKVEKSWKLNERHYGALQGLNKESVAKKYGNDQLKKWRRSFLCMPPKLDINDDRFSGNERKYSSIDKKEIPLSENLKLTFDRVVNFWKTNIFPNIKKNKKILIVAHGNSLRALIKYLDNIDDIKINDLNIPTGKPIVYNFDSKNNVISRNYL